MQAKSIKLSDIRIDGGTQPRESIDQDLVAEYAESLDSLPPMVLFDDGASLWLADGFHRYHALTTADRKEALCYVKNGTQRAAVLFSVGANAEHGKRRTNADKRKAVQTLLKDEEWGKWSDREIAKQCRVGHPLVASLRPKDVTGSSSSDKEPVRVYKAKSGAISEMKVAKKARTAPPPEVKPLTPYELAKANMGPLRELHALIIEAGKLAATVAADKAVGHYVRLQQIQDGLETAKRAVNFAMPKSPCPYMPNCVHGKCRCCKGAGWIPADVYDALNKTEKAMLEGGK